MTYEDHAVPDWSSAQCSGLTEFFFSTDEDDLAAAVAICRTCPIEDACLTYALRNPDKTEFGVWGGLTEKTRRTMHSGRARVHCPRCLGANVNRSQRDAHICVNCGLSWRMNKRRYA